MRAPHARLYSSKLFQWIDYAYLQAMKNLLPNYEDYFDESDFKPLMFAPDFKWHFTKAEPYKHYFYIFDSQVRGLPANQIERISFLKDKITIAIDLFGEIEEQVFLDGNSD